jgi:hypothetical protein
MRRPSIRSLAGGAAGITAGVIGGVVLTAVSAAGPRPASGGPHVIDAAHVPPLLTLPGERIRLRYGIVCAPRDDGLPCNGSGTVYIRPGRSGEFRPLPLQRGDDSRDGRYYADVPRVGSAEGFAYYAVLRDEATGSSITVPSGGAAAPQVSLPLRDPVSVALGRHVFGRVRAPDAEVARASWGSAPHDVGLGGSRELGFTGPSSFDVEADGTVDLLDSVNGRVMRWAHGQREVVPLPGAAELADFGVGADGDFDVLDPRAMLRSFDAHGSPRWAQRLSDRTWAKLEEGAAGPVVLQLPSEQWMPIAEADMPLTRAEQSRSAHAGRRLASGHDLLVDRVGTNELRVAEVGGLAVLRAWQVTSETPLGEVQLAERRGDDIVVVTRAYTDERDEFVVLVLSRAGLAASFSVASESWTETAPLARFRLARGSLHRLHTTQAGAVVDRFDLEVPR